MGRFGPTGEVQDPVVEHSVAALSWGVLRGALGPSDGSAGAACNVPSALAVVRHAQIYLPFPEEIDEAFGVLEQHVIRHGKLYPVAVATLPFLFDSLRRSTPVGERVTDLIAMYAAAVPTLEAPLAERVTQIIVDHAPEIVRWLGKFDRALCALAIHLPKLRELFVAAIEGAERVAPEILLALCELDCAPGETLDLALFMLDGADSTDRARMCAAAFLARYGANTTELRTRVDAALPPSAPAALRDFIGKLWNPTFVRPVVAPKMLDAEVVFSGAKLVLVKAGSHSVTLPWAGANLQRGDKLRVGITVHGQAKLAVLTDPDGTVRVIDF